ncbi:MAG: efflux RND transporter periplasmic adaptor subunit [Paraglaciecola sp.]|nr:efflux RND transporter periplasmic adaptor subunit [Paraglaciecola sp.]NCT48770.1 efflux RND transporter periplasmic adaptor subunit [Paraglaciecola sp.]
MSVSTTRKVLFPLGAVVVLGISVAWMAGLFSTKVAPGLLQSQPISIQPLWTVTTQTVQRTEGVAATVTARDTTLLSSRIMARIEAIKVRAGDHVAQGSLLVSLENSALLSQVAQANSRIQALQGLLQEAKNTLIRTQNLKESSLVSNAELDKAQANFTRLNNELLAAEQNKQEVQTALSYSEIRAPIAGTIVERSAEPGNMAVPGQPLLALYNPESLLVEANVREALAVNLSLNQSVDVMIDSVGLRLQGNIIELVPAGDPNAHSFVVKVNIQALPTNSSPLRPGMFARLSLPLENQQHILIPLSLVQSFGQLDRVWVINEGQWQSRFVRLAEQVGEQVEVVSGLKPGEQLGLPAA